MHNLKVPSFYFKNNTSVPQVDTLGLIFLLSIISLSCSFISTNSRVLIMYGALDVGVASNINSIEKFASLWGSNSGISIGNTSWDYCKIGYLLSTSWSSSSFPLSLETWTTNNTYVFLWLWFSCIVITIQTDVGFLFPFNILLSPSSSRHLMVFS